MNKFRYVLTFLAGSALGAAASFLLLRKKFDEQRLYFENKYGSSDTDNGDTPDTPDEKSHDISKEDMMDYYKNKTPNDISETPEKAKVPHVIHPDDFGMLDYDTITLTLYFDGVVADDNDFVVDGDILGDDWKNHFGEFEPDAVYVRNDILKADYEILRDNNKFSDICNTVIEKPNKVEI